jgi:hypothetical protein
MRNEAITACLNHLRQCTIVTANNRKAVVRAVLLMPHLVSKNTNIKTPKQSCRCLLQAMIAIEY